MYFVSPFTPLFFSPSKDNTGTVSRYCQIFSESDRIMLQVIARYESRVIQGIIIDVSTNVMKNIDWKLWSINSSTQLYYYIITGLDEGFYQVDINGVRSNTFQVVKQDDSELDDTVLIQYSMKDNTDRQNAIFWVSNIQHFFDFRVHGGFKDEDWSFQVNNEQFVDADYNISEIFSLERTSKILTMGNSKGCPIWFAELLNRILSCNYVYIDGDRYVRYESSTPEINVLMEGYRSYVFKQSLIRIDAIEDNSENDNIIRLRRVDDRVYRKASSRLLMI